MTSKGRFARHAMLAYGLLAYASFHASFLYLILFLNDVPLPFSLGSGSPRPLGQALAIDVGLIALFALQHTVMARPAFKRVWTRFVPAPIERSTFVVATVVCLVLLFTCWAPIAGHVWHVEAPVLRGLLWALQGVGWLTVVVATFLIDHWGLFGLRQVAAHHRGVPSQDKTFRMPLLYRFVRHPMMTGMLIGLWATPDMSAGHLVIAAGFSLYVLVGIRIEERDLVAALGDDYRHYQQRVPRLVPGLPRPRRGAMDREAPRPGSA